VIALRDGQQTMSWGAASPFAALLALLTFAVICMCYVHVSTPLALPALHPLPSAWRVQLG
jgi:hypothetical protein